VAERADQPACLGAVEHDGRSLAVPEGAEPDERGPSGGTHVRAVVVGVDDERRAEFRGERGEGAARLRALLERARVVAQEQVDLAAAGEALKGGALARGGPEPAAIVTSGPDRTRAAVGKAAQAAEPEACSGRQVVEAEAERHGAGCGHAGAGSGERPGVIVVSFDEQELQAREAEEGAGRAEEAASFRRARQVAEIAERDERIATLLDGALDQAAQVASVAVQVADDEQTAHSSRGYRAPAHGRKARAGAASRETAQLRRLPRRARA
jgi:hypothetical protein